jgi:hypothetical protein
MAVSGEVNASLVLSRVKATQAGSYDVIVSNASGSVTSQVAALTINIPAGSPAITVQPAWQIVRASESASLSVGASGATPLSYQWYKGMSGDTNGLIAGATNSNYLVINPTATTSFWVNVQNVYGTTDSDTATVIVCPSNAAKLKLQMIGGQVGISIDGTVRTTYRIEYSTNLVTGNWSELLDITLPNSPFTFFDSGASNAVPRFYRAVIR